MINLSAIPIAAIIGAITFIFGLGVAVQKFISRSITPEQLTNALNNCRKNSASVQPKQLKAHSIECHSALDDRFRTVEAKILALVKERREIWGLVRETEKKTAVLVADMEWLKNAISRMNENKTNSSASTR